MRWDREPRRRRFPTNGERMPYDPLVAIAAGNKNAADMYREQIVALSNKLSDSKVFCDPR